MADEVGRRNDRHFTGSYYYMISIFWRESGEFKAGVSPSRLYDDGAEILSQPWRIAIINPLLQDSLSHSTIPLPHLLVFSIHSRFSSSQDLRLTFIETVFCVTRYVTLCRTREVRFLFYPLWGCLAHVFGMQLRSTALTNHNTG